MSDLQVFPIKVGFGGSSKVVGIKIIESTRTRKEIYKGWNYWEELKIKIKSIY